MSFTKGQVSVETMAVVGIILLLFAIVSTTVAYRNIQSQIIEENYNEFNSCSEISMLITNSYSHGPKSEIFVTSALDMIVQENEVHVGSNYCHVTGKVSDATLVAGIIRIKNINGVVQLENV
ncbi:MAG: hypothetical protein V1672_01160 [Candidatus Diapherotrites archaeon]